ncbi:hypothetical protein [Nocardioides sp. cx-173]|uniref:DUF7224 domain-containing protein n=1 Tax=Nocardioides sp. cx-173 TaxID=2898796 RepID=UPI001E3A5D74|nr:hypothetical protein [Nocardioides sp. cx-173]MCD4523353.1 hypothetical protein [Nocardioides sp. cx-173]UGB42307.1 hypothetical protein LQ940_01975 [Nocardioides sp. cx-173]
MSRGLTWLGGPRVATVLVAVLVALGLVPTLSRGADWLGSWKMALGAGLFGLTLIGPAASGIACAVYARFAGSGAERLVAIGPRPWWPWLRPALATWSLAAAALLAITLATTTASWLAGSVAYPETAWVVVPALCVLAAQVAVGVLLGATGRRRWLAPVAAVATFGLGVLGAVGVIADIFRVGAITGSYAGETFDASTYALQAGAALGAAAGLLLLSNRTAVGGAPLPRAVVLACVLGGAGCYVAMGQGLHEFTRPVADPQLVCRGTTVRVCLARETTRPLDDLAARMERQAAALTDLGLDLPPRFVQPEAARDPDPAHGVLSLLDEELADTVSDESAARSLATPADCAAYSADIPPPEASFDARRLLARWLLMRAGLLEPDLDDVDGAWLGAGLDEQRSWVVSTYDRLRRCDLEALRLPAGV